VTVLRGSETNAFDDVVDSDTAVYTGVLVAITESSRRTYLPAEGATRVIRSYIGYATSSTDIQKGDRLRSEKNSAVYLVVDLSAPSSAALDPDLRFELSKTT
jgi:hypothetical protein